MTAVQNVISRFRREKFGDSEEGEVNREDRGAKAGTRRETVAWLDGKQVEQEYPAWPSHW